MQTFKLQKVLSGCLKNDRKAQERLYKQYFALMYHICKDFASDRDTVMSLVNEGFLKIFMNLEAFDSRKGEFESWAKKIVTNNCIDFARKKTNTLYVEDISDVGEAYHQQIKAPDFVEDEILHYLKKMPQTTRQVFTMHIFNGFSHKEIGKIMNMAESTSRWHLLEARKELKKVAHKIC